MRCSRDMPVVVSPGKPDSGTRGVIGNISLQENLLQMGMSKKEGGTITNAWHPFGSELIAGLAVGWLLDTWLDTGHLFLIIGTLMGLIVGGIGFIRSAMKATREAAKRVQEQSGPPS